MVYRVLHVLDHSWPLLSGYSVRSQNLVAAQHRLGQEPRVVTGPLHQLDDSAASDAVFEGVPYWRTPFRGNLSRLAVARRWPPLREATVVLLLRRRILDLLEHEPFDLIHAHSPALCGLAAWHAARSRRIPFIYEIRAFWEDAAVDQKKSKQDSARYRLSRSLEGFVARRADAVVGIARHILDDLWARGISPGKLFHIPNGVDAERFSPLPRDTRLAAELGLDNEPVLGFIGTLYRYEGISWLVRAAAELRRRGLSFRLLIIGHGEDIPEITAAVREADAGDYIRVLGQIPHDQIQRYYSVMDILVYPRRRVRLTELVTPLKPLEAMAQGKAVLASSVGGLRELVEQEKTGVLFEPDDIDDFCRQAERLLRDEEWRRELGKRAREIILREKDWKVLAGRYEEIYDLAVGRARSRLHP